MAALPYQTMSQVLPGHRIENRIVIYSCVGGIPHYLNEMEQGASLDHNLKRLLSHTFMLGDASTLLHDQIARPRNHANVIESGRPD